jgi:hypothetical protein
MLQPAVESHVGSNADEFGAWTGYRVPEDRAGWHPLIARLYDYWRAVTPAGRLPGRQHIVPEDIAPLWSRLWLLDVVRGPPLRFRYRVCGTELVRAFGAELTGRWLDEAHPELVANPQSRDRFRFAVLTGQPTWRHGSPLWKRNPDQRTVESCIVPLATDGTSVDKLLGVVVAFDIAGRQI